MPYIASSYKTPPPERPPAAAMNSRILPWHRLALATSLLIFTACGGSSGGGGGVATGSTEASLTETLQQLGLDTFLELVGLAGLQNELEGPGPLTVLAPTDAAFDALPPGRLDELRDPLNVDELRALLLGHFVEAEISQAMLGAERAILTRSGEYSTVGVIGGTTYVNGGALVDADVATTSGVVHTLDDVLVERVPLVENLRVRGFSTFLTMMRRAGVDGTKIAPATTVLAPTNEAFDAVPAETLRVWLAPENQDVLRRVIDHHRLLGRRTVSSLLAEGEAETLAGTTLQFSVGASRAEADGSAFLTFDKPSVNGMLHGLEVVLLPPPTDGGGEPLVVDDPREVRELSLLPELGDRRVAGQAGRSASEAARAPAQDAATGLLAHDGGAVSLPIATPFETLVALPAGPWARIDLDLEEPFGPLQVPVLLGGKDPVPAHERYAAPGGATYVWRLDGPDARSEVDFGAEGWAVKALPAPFVRPIAATVRGSEADSR